MSHPTTHTERMRIILAAAVAVAMVVAIMLAAASAQGGSGGVGSGGGGSDSGGDRYSRMWDNFSTKHKRWAHRTSKCESGDRPKVHGGGGSYHGAFQFMKSTWKSSPKSPGGDPHTYAWKTQAVVAVKLKQRDGAHHWPNCG